MNDPTPTPARPSRPVRIVAVDDHPLLIEGMIAVLARESTVAIEWLGVAGTRADFLDLLAGLQVRPDLALVDLHLPDRSSPSDLVADLVARGIRCVVVTAEVRSVPLRLAVQAGAQALFLKHESTAHFAEVIERVLAGEELVSSDIAAALLADDALVVDLTPKEHDVIRHVADGLPRKLVAKHTGIAETTVSTHLKHVVAKYREQGRAHGNTIELLREVRRDGHLLDD